ncbi:TetR/AcrR family transcriptional regulator [Glycomyces sp. A-F 0318]|uniref:TetR/AcrR family transcriptional regulator n=1 Tax=Glycomyces amatae TaxID=2881355 RepID=UPI001E5FA67B|nr:TetR/AcrR family transcriptional regulator [Glycomyces amatae]
MASRDDWITAGLEALAETGLPGVRIDRIAARLGVSKGSFHHHFNGADAYRRAMLERYGDRAVEAMRRTVADAPGEGLERIEALVGAFDGLYDARIETALRAWARHDDDAQRVVAGIDRARLEALQEVWTRLLPGAETARIAALVPHLVVIGASAAPWSVADGDLAAVMRLLARIAPALAEPSGDEPA